MQKALHIAIVCCTVQPIGLRRQRKYHINGRDYDLSIASLCHCVSSSSWKRFCTKIVVDFETVATNKGMDYKKFPYYMKYGGFWLIKGTDKVPPSKYTTDNLDDTREVTPMEET